MGKIEHIQYIKTPVSKVYEALKTQQGLTKTWTNKLIVKPKPGFVNEFDFDDNYSTKMRVVELAENRRIAWECIDSDPEWIGTTVSFDLAEKEGVTSVILRQLNWKEITEFYWWCNYNRAIFLYSLKPIVKKGRVSLFKSVNCKEKNSFFIDKNKHGSGSVQNLVDLFFAKRNGSAYC